MIPLLFRACAFYVAFGFICVRVDGALRYVAIFGVILLVEALMAELTESTKEGE